MFKMIEIDPGKERLDIFEGINKIFRYFKQPSNQLIKKTSIKIKV